MSTAIVMTEHGGPEVLEFTHRELPEPESTQVRIKTEAIGVNFIDIYRREGRYPVSLPHIPGTEVVGIIEAVGSEVTQFSVGDRVVTVEGLGAYAEHVLAEASGLFRIPDNVSFEQAAAVMLQGLTAHYLSTSVFKIDAHHNVLIHAGAGGVGLLLTQLAKRRGATVITSVSTPEKAELSRAAGADHVLGYENIAAEVRNLTKNIGVDVVFDGVGQATFDESLASLRKRGLLALFGASSGNVPPFDLNRLNLGGSLVVTRPSMGDFLLTPEERAWRAREILDAVGSGELDVRIGARFDLKHAADAHTALGGRQTTGKVVLIP